MTTAFNRSLPFVLFLLVCSSLAAQTEWTARNPAPTAARIKQVAFGAGKFVAVGESGAVVTSTDGANWTEQRLADRAPFEKIIYAGAQFVALDSAAVSYTSPDGVGWTKRTSTGGLGELAHGNGTYLTLSAGNLFASSADAITWTPRTTGTTLTGTSVTFGSNLFVAATRTAVYLTTPDGLTWTARSFPTGASVSTIRFGHDIFVALLGNGATARSLDAINWQVSATVNLMDLGYANNRFFATRTSSGRLVVSDDGLIWSDATSPGTTFGVPSTIVYGNSVYVSLEQATAYSTVSSYPSISYTKFHSSPDAETWTQRSRFFGPPANVAYGLGLFIAGDYLSSDGFNWAPGGFGPTLPRSDTSYYYGDRSYRYKFVGNRFFAFQQSYPFRVFTSTDGRTSNLVLSQNSNVQDVAYGTDRYVMVLGFGQIMTSPDAQTWSVAHAPGDFMTAVIFAKGLFVVVTSGNNVLRSADGLSWAGATIPAIGGGSRAKVAYGNGTFVIVRENGEVFTSADAITWTAQPTLAFGLASLAFANGTFVAGGLDRSIYTSTDGINWTARESRASDTVTDLAFGNGQWVGVARMSGTVVQSNTTSGAAVPPSLVLAPQNVTQAGDGIASISLLVSVTGTGPFTYQWYRDGAAIPEATQQSLSMVLPAVTATVADEYRVVIAGPGGALTSPVATVTNVPPQPPVIVAEPGDALVAMHSPVTFSVAATGTGPFSYQWRKDGVPLAPSAHHLYLQTKLSTLSLFNVAPIDGGRYDVVVTGRAGSVTSRAAQLTLRQSRLINLSARAHVGTGENALFAGFVLANDNAPATAANWTVLARAAGPALQPLGVNQYLGNPSIDLFQVINGQPVLQANNDNWGTHPPLVHSLYNQLTALVGAFAFATDSLDAGILRQGYQLNYNTAPQIYSAIVRGAPGESGIALVEFYDASSVHARLLNLSARARVGTGDDVLIAGFVITGSVPLKVLLRGVGPTLARQGVNAFLSNPKLTLYDRGGQPIHSNDTWSSTTELAELIAASKTVGAFDLGANSQDAALLVSLDPGVYSVIVSSADGTPGIALAEIYEVP